MRALLVPAAAVAALLITGCANNSTTTSTSTSPTDGPIESSSATAPPSLSAVAHRFAAAYAAHLDGHSIGAEIRRSPRVERVLAQTPRWPARLRPVRLAGLHRQALSDGYVADIVAGRRRARLHFAFTVKVGQVVDLVPPDPGSEPASTTAPPPAATRAIGVRPLARRCALAVARERVDRRHPRAGTVRVGPVDGHQVAVAVLVHAGRESQLINELLISGPGGWSCGPVIQPAEVQPDPRPPLTQPRQEHQ